MAVKLSNEEFIKKSKQIWGNKYDYSLVEYKNMKTKIKLICENNHIFDITPDNHLRLRGCLYCSNKVNLVIDKDGFVEKSNKTHNSKYDYSIFEYKNSTTKSKIICNIHGVFEQTSNAHMAGSGCKHCYIDLLKSDTKHFIEKSKKIHNNKYDYSLVEYKKSGVKVKIICPIHGIFKQSPSVHLSGSGCRNCMIDNLCIGFEEFKRRSIEIHGNIYEYDASSYKNLKLKTTLICPKHGSFKIIADNHISKKRGCIKCSTNISKLEKEWLDSIGIEDKYRQYVVKINKKIYKVDGYSPIDNIIYEFYGDFFHGNPKIYNKDDVNPLVKQKYSDLYNKTIERENELILSGYKIVSIWEDDYKKIYKK